MALIDSRRALLTYALVSDSLDRYNDFLLGLTPLFSIIAEQRDGQLFAPGQFAADVAEAFGIELPVEVASFLQSRLQKDGLLSRLTGPNSTLAFVWKKAPNPAGDSSNVEKRVDELFDKFEEYCKNFPSLTSISFRRNEMETGLLDWVITNDGQLKQALTAIVSGESKINTPRVLRSEMEYLCASFIANLQKADNASFELIAQIANAALVSEAVLGPVYKVAVRKHLRIAAMCSASRNELASLS